MRHLNDTQIPAKADSTQRLRSIPAAALVAAGLAAAMAFPEPAAATKYAAEFLKLGVGARALGLGGAFVAMADDASTVYWNPAGVANLERAELMVMHAEQFGSLATHDYLGFAQPLAGDRRSAVGIGLVRFAVDDIKVTRDAFQDLNGDGEYQEGEPILTDKFRTESDSEYALFVTYAREVSDALALGVSAKSIRQGLVGNSSFGFGLDFGAHYRANSALTFGARLADVGTTLSWDSGTRESVTPQLSLGATWRRAIPGLRGSLAASGNLVYATDGRDEASQLGSGADLQGGVEYWFDRVVAARVGSDAGDFTAGAGLRHRGLGIDYAFLGHADLDDTHRISASVAF